VRTKEQSFSQKQKKAKAKVKTTKKSAGKVQRSGNMSKRANVRDPRLSLPVLPIYAVPKNWISYLASQYTVTNDRKKAADMMGYTPK